MTTTPIAHTERRTTIQYSVGDLVTRTTGDDVFRLIGKTRYNRWIGVEIPMQSGEILIPTRDLTWISSDAPFSRGHPTLAFRVTELTDVIMEIPPSSITSQFFYCALRTAPPWFRKTIATDVPDCRRLTWADNIRWVDNDKRRKVGTISTFVAFCIKRGWVSYSDKEREAIAYDWGEHVVARDSFEFDIVRGPDIVAAYKQSNPSWNSCMSQNDSVWMYAQNPDQVGLIKVMRKQNDGSRRYVGRALLWTMTDGRRVLSRRYPDHAKHNKVLVAWAQEHGILDIYATYPDKKSWEVILPNEIHYPECPNNFPYIDLWRVRDVDTRQSYGDYQIPTRRRLRLTLS